MHGASEKTLPQLSLPKRERSNTSEARAGARRVATDSESTKMVYLKLVRHAARRTKSTRRLLPKRIPLQGRQRRVLATDFNTNHQVLRQRTQTRRQDGPLPDLHRRLPHDRQEDRLRVARRRISETKGSVITSRRPGRAPTRSTSPGRSQLHL